MSCLPVVAICLSLFLAAHVSSAEVPLSLLADVFESMIAAIYVPFVGLTIYGEMGRVDRLGTPSKV